MNHPIFQEIGYTPKNLRSLRQHYELKQQEVANIVGVSSWRTVAKWEADISLPSHADMPYRKWLILLNHLSISLPLG